MSAELPDYKTTPKCADNSCNKSHLKNLDDGRQFLCCTKCGHIVEQLMKKKEECDHAVYKEFTAKKGANAGRRFGKCTQCGDFKWMDEQDGADQSNKRRRVDNAGASGPGFDLTPEIARLNKLVDSLQVQMLSMQQQLARFESKDE